MFREQLDIQRGAVGCALVVLMAPSGQLRRPQLLVQELSRCGALQGCPKIFLLLSSGLKGECLGSDPSSGREKQRWGMSRKAGTFWLTYTALVLLPQLPGSLKLSSRVWGKSATNVLTGHCCSC